MSKQALALVMVASCVVLVAPCMWGQTSGKPATEQAAQEPSPRFDVATVKPNTSAVDSSRLSSYPDHLLATHASLEALIENAYSVRGQQIEGLPAWARDLHWDVVAKVITSPALSAADGADAQRRMRLAAILVDRFGLKSHWETREGSVLFLESDKGATRLVAASPDYLTRGERSLGNTHITSPALSLAVLAEALSQRSELPVQDHTGLASLYAIDLKWSASETNSQQDQALPELPSLPAALHEQLGLRLVRGKGPVPTLVVEAVAKPDAD